MRRLHGRDMCMSPHMRPFRVASAWKEDYKNNSMAGIKDILDIEQERSEPKDWQVINLFQEGILSKRRLPMYPLSPTSFPYMNSTKAYLE